MESESSGTVADVDVVWAERVVLRVWLGFEGGEIALSNPGDDGSMKMAAGSWYAEGRGAECQLFLCGASIVGVEGSVCRRGRALSGWQGKGDDDGADALDRGDAVVDDDVLLLVVKTAVDRGLRHSAKVLAGLSTVSSPVDEVVNDPADELGTLVYSSKGPMRTTEATWMV